MIKMNFQCYAKALKDFKANTEVNVPIFLKLTSDLELDGFKNILPAITETLMV